MNKLVINSVKINSVNSQTLPLKEFKEGFNIICGSNEAGKSTMMKFLKECFFSSKDIAGDIELTGNGITYQIKVDGKKGKKERVKLISPTDKNIEDLLSHINQNLYQKAFSINLDDIRNIDNDLFNIIQDHNANALSTYKTKLEDEIHQYLTDGGKPNKKLTDLVKSIANLDKEIRALSNKENDYAKLIEDIRVNNDFRQDIKNKIENKILIENIRNLSEELKNKQERLALIERNLNKALINQKQDFYNLNSKTGLIINYIEELNALSNSQNQTKINEILETIRLNYGISASVEELEKVNLSKEFENKIRRKKEEINQKDLQLKTLIDTRDKLLKIIEQKKNECKKQEETILELGINDYELFKEGLAELSAAITSLGENGEQHRQKNDKIKTIIYLVTAAIITATGFYIQNKAGILLIIAGIVIGLISIPSFLSKTNNNSINIYDYVKSDILPKLNRKDCFLRTVPALNTILSNENTKLNKYELFKNDYNIKSEELEKTNSELSEVSNAIQKLENDLNKEIQTLSTDTTLLKKQLSTDIFLELIDKLRELAQLVYKSNEEDKRKLYLSAEIEIFTKDLKEFLDSTNLDSSVNNLDLLNKTNEILSQISENDKLKHEYDTLSEEISIISTKIKENSVLDLTPGKKLSELQEENDKLNEQCGLLEAEKKALESFEGLIHKRNEKNIKACQLKDIIQQIYSKKLALNIIEEAERQQRAQEPNLISAENLLAKITGGKYVNANYAACAIVTKNGELKEQDELSRGTREQLYLAFRLGYAQNYGADGQHFRLPLIIDDAFVNFDKERLSNVISALKEFAKTNQVLFFTCHKDYITGIAGENVNIIDID